MSVTSFIVSRALRSIPSTHILEFMNIAFKTKVESVDPNFFKYWLIKYDDDITEKWNEHVQNREYEELHHMISDFETNIMYIFELAAQEFGLEQNELDGISPVEFRSLVCENYIMIFSEYVEHVFPGFEEITKIVYDYVFEEPDEGSEDIM